MMENVVAVKEYPQFFMELFIVWHLVDQPVRYVGTLIGLTFALVFLKCGFVSAGDGPNITQVDCRIACLAILHQFDLSITD